MGARNQFCPATTLPPNAAIPISVTTLTNWQNRPAQGELVFEQPGNYTLRVVARLDGENTASTEIPIEVVDPETPGEQELFDLLRAHPSYGELLESGSLDRLERRNPQSHIDAVQRFETVLSLLGEQQSELKALIAPVRNSRKEIK